MTTGQLKHQQETAKAHAEGYKNAWERRKAMKQAIDEGEERCQESPEHHIIRGKLAGAYGVDLASSVTPTVKKKLTAVLYIDEDNSYGLYFHVNVNGSLIETQNLSYAIRAYETQLMKDGIWVK